MKIIIFGSTWSFCLETKGEGEEYKGKRNLREIYQTAQSRNNKHTGSYAFCNCVCVYLCVYVGGRGHFYYIMRINYIYVYLNGKFEIYSKPKKWILRIILKDQKKWSAHWFF